jgi:negative regulator of sigma E activity
MSANTAWQYEHKEAPATPRVPAQVIPLHPTVWQRVREWARRTLTPEAIAEVVLAVTTLVLSGVLFFALYHGLQNYTVF